MSEFFDSQFFAIASRWQSLIVVLLIALSSGTAHEVGWYKALKRASVPHEPLAADDQQILNKLGALNQRTLEILRSKPDGHFATSTVATSASARPDR